MGTKLSANTQAVLDEINAGATAHYMPYRGTFNPREYWFLSTTFKRVTREIEKLLKLGLIRSGYRKRMGPSGKMMVVDRDDRVAVRLEPEVEKEGV